MSGKKEKYKPTNLIMEEDDAMDFHEESLKAGFEPPTPAHDPKITPFEEEDLGEERTKRLDRQIRLWGVEGQKKIDRAKILVLGGSSIGAEVLKNLILPGFVKFTIMDDAIVTPRDLGNNFFVTKDDLGKKRGGAVCVNLSELNPDVKKAHAHFMGASYTKLIETHPATFNEYSTIIACQLPFHLLEKLGKHCEKNGATLISVRSYGMVGYVRVLGGCHTIKDSKLDEEKVDLRLFDPWPDLVKWCDMQQMEKMNNRDHSHTPYIVILVKVVMAWKAKHDGKLPKSDSEKQEFRKMIGEMSRLGGLESNIVEANSKAYLAYNPVEYSDQVLRILNHPRAKNIDKSSSMFWVLVNACKKFYDKEGNGLLPMQGIIPDMHSDTSRFTWLQSLYRRKHRVDLSVVRGYMEETCKKIEMVPASEWELSTFVKNLPNIRVIDYTSVTKELDDSAIDTTLLQEAFWEGPGSPAIWYLCLRAADEFHKKHGKHPGEDFKASPEELARDAKELYGLLKNLVLRLKLKLPYEDEDKELAKYATEFTRYGAAELHTISALIGGVASQEIIKIITGQRVPVNCTWLYSGTSSKSVVLDF